MTATEQKNKLIKTYHTLIGKTKMSDDNKRILLAQWNVSTSKDMSVDQLEQLCNLLRTMTPAEDSELAKWQEWTRTMVKNCGRSLGLNYSDAYAEAIICTAAKKKSFNDITINRLRGLYNHFKKAKNDGISLQNLIIEDAQAVASLN